MRRHAPARLPFPRAAAILRIIDEIRDENAARDLRAVRVCRRVDQPVSEPEALAHSACSSLDRRSVNIRAL